MVDIAADTNAIRAYGDTSAALATEVCAVGAIDQAATIAAVLPVFGLIGADFVASFAGAQANHLSSVGEIAAVHAGTALACYGGGAKYDSSEAISGAEFGAIESSI